MRVTSHTQDIGDRLASRQVQFSKHNAAFLWHCTVKTVPLCRRVIVPYRVKGARGNVGLVQVARRVLQRHARPPACRFDRDRFASWGCTPAKVRDRAEQGTLGPEYRQEGPTACRTAKRCLSAQIVYNSGERTSVRGNQCCTGYPRLVCPSLRTRIPSDATAKFRRKLAAIAPCYSAASPRNVTAGKAVASPATGHCVFLVNHGRKSSPFATGMVRPPTNTSTT